MDTRRHGNPRWLSRTVARRPYQARNGKTELSLIHFMHTNPNWRMPNEAAAFIDQLRDQVMRESSINMSTFPVATGATTADNAAGNSGDQPGDSLNKSLYHLQSLVYNSNMPTNLMSK